MSKFEVSIAEPMLRQMEEDASKAKAELNLVAHVRTLVAEVRRLAQQVEEKPTRDQADAAQRALDWFRKLDVSGSSIGGEGVRLAQKSAAVLERFLS